MVASVSALSNAGQAASYYEADDYYAEGGMAPSEWLGEAAEKAGSVRRGQSREFCRIAPRPDCRAAARHHARWPGRASPWLGHYPVRAQVGLHHGRGCRRQAADQGAWRGGESSARACRETHGGNADQAGWRGPARGDRQSCNRYFSPCHEPGAGPAAAHPCRAIINATQDKDGNWRSLEPRAFYQLQKEIGAIYRQELAQGVTALGYKIEAGKDSLFEIAGVPDKAIDALSQRTAAIDARLAERGTSRAEASAAEKQIAALDTREAKSQCGSSHLARRLAGNCQCHRVRQGSAKQANSRGERAGQKQRNNRKLQNCWQGRRWPGPQLICPNARGGVFGQHPRPRSRGLRVWQRPRYATISAAIVGGRRSAASLSRVPSLTGAARNLPGSQRRRPSQPSGPCCDLEEAGRGMAQSLASPVAVARTIERAARQSARSGYAWTDDQKRATAKLLTSSGPRCCCPGLRRDCQDHDGARNLRARGTATRVCR